MRETSNLEVLHSNDVGRCGSTALSGLQDVKKLGVVIGKNDSDAERTKYEECTKSPVDSLEGVLDVNAWALSLT